MGRREGGDVGLTFDPVAALRAESCVVTDRKLSTSEEPGRTTHLPLAVYQAPAKLPSHAAADGVFMPWLPAHRGEEVHAEVFGGPPPITGIL